MRRRNQRSKTEENVRRKKRLRVAPRFPMIALLTLGLLVVTFAWGLPKYQRIRDLNYQISVMEERKEALEAERQRLIKEAEWLETDAAVEKIAREELGLVRPGERPLIEVNGSY